MWKGFDLGSDDQTVIDCVVPNDDDHGEMTDDILGGLVAAGCSNDEITVHDFVNSPDRRIEILVRNRVRYVVRKDMK